MRPTLKTVGSALVLLIALIVILFASADPDVDQSQELTSKLALLHSDPILSLEGTDLDALKVALQALEDAQQTLANLQTPEYRHFVANDLFPMRFLRSLVALEEARLNALTERTERSFITYELALRSTLLEAQADLARFRNAYEASVDERHATVATLGGALTKEHTLETLDIIASAYDEAARQAIARSECLRTGATLCERDTPLVIALPQEPPRNMSIMEDVQGIYDAASISPQEGAVIALNGSSCLHNLSGWDFMARRPIRDTAFSAHQYVGDIILRPLQDTEGPAAAWYRAHGLDYIPHNPFISYTCPLVGSDKTRLYALSEMARILELRGDVLYETDIVHAARASQIEPISSWLRTYDMRTAGFHDAVYDAARSAQALLAQREAGAPTDTSAAFLFATHSAYVTLFAAYNRTLMSETPNPYGSAAPGFWGEFTLYSNLPAQATTHLVDDIRFFFEAHL